MIFSFKITLPCVDGFAAIRFAKRARGIVSCANSCGVNATWCTQNEKASFHGAESFRMQSSSLQSKKRRLEVIVVNCSSAISLICMTAPMVLTIH